MRTPHPGEIILEWKNISYSVESKKFKLSKLKRIKDSTQVLKNVSGSIQSGQLVAIIGPSGAGKSTLLAAISQRLRGEVSGSIRLNGITISRTDMVKRSSFIPQFDITSDFMTVSELMHFVFRLRNCTATESKHVQIENVLRQLGIHKVLHTRISVLSGGERKILNLATEFLSDPSIVFCDEPTTGLDSFNALLVLKTLQRLVNIDSPAKTKHISAKAQINGRLEEMMCGKAVVCAIHQPSSAVFACFSHVILMQGGHIAYQGTVKEAENAMSRMGFPCLTSFNRADFFIKTLIDNSGSISFVGDLQKLYTKQVQSIIASPVQWPKTYNKNISWVRQVFTLCQRFFLESRRTGWKFIYRMLSFYLTALSIGALFMAVDTSDKQAVQNISGLTFNLVTQIIFSTAYNVIYYYPSQLPILRRETGEQMYSLSAFYVAFLICCIPKSAVEIFVFLAIIYPFVGFIKGLWMFVAIGLTLTIISIPATAYGLMLSGIFESSLVATSIAPPFDVMFVLLGGVYIKLKTFYYLQYLSMFFYANESMSILIWKDIEKIDLHCPANSTDFCPETVTDVLEFLSYGTTYTTVWIDYAGLFGCALVMNVVGFFGVRMMVRRTGYY